MREGRIAGAALDVFVAEPTTESPLFELDSVVVTPHLGASTAEAQDKAGQTIAEQVVLALRGEFVPFAVNLAATEASATVQPFMPLAERLGRLFTALAGGAVDTLEISYEGQIADYDCRVLTLVGAEGRARPGGRRAGVVRERAAARRGARARRARDDVVVGARLREPHRAARPHPAAAAPTSRARSTASRTRPASSRIDDYIVDLAAVEPHARGAQRRPARAWSAGSARSSGDHGINIDELDLGKGPSGDASLMLLSTIQPVPADVVAELRATTASSTPRPSSSTDLPSPNSASLRPPARSARLATQFVVRD